MYWGYANNSTPVARKEYHCEASDWIRNGPGIDDSYFTEDEMKVIRKAKAEGWKILKGSKYFKTEGVWDGEWSTFRARVDLNQICLDHDLYGDC